MNEEKCTVCGKPLQQDDVKSKVFYAGLQTFIAKSKKIEDEKWKAWENISLGQHIVLHEKCRKGYSSQREKPLSQRRKRLELLADHAESTDDDDDGIPAKPFDFENLCILCDKQLEKYKKKVHTLMYEHKDIGNWSRFADEEQAKEIVRRVRFARANNISVMYHNKCRKPHDYSPKVKDNSTVNEAATLEETSEEILEETIEETPEVNLVDNVFELVTNYIENSGEYKFELTKLRKIMEEDNTIVLTEHMLSKKLQEKYGDDITIVRRIGNTLLYFYKAKNLFDRSNEWIATPQTLSDFEKSIILKISADIIKREILDHQYEYKEYPPEDTFISKIETDVPKLLNMFTDRLLHHKVMDHGKNIKCANIAHAFITSNRPRSFISTLQLAVGTFVHKKTKSKLIVDLLNRLGVSASYRNIQKYEAFMVANPPQVDQDNSLLHYLFKSHDSTVFCCCNGDCSSPRCSCQKNESKCSYYCRNCDNQRCSNYNVEQVPIDDDYNINDFIVFLNNEGDNDAVNVVVEEQYDNA